MQSRPGDDPRLAVWLWPERLRQAGATLSPHSSHAPALLLMLPSWMAPSPSGPAWTTPSRRKAKNRIEPPSPAGQLEGATFYSNGSSSSSLTLPQLTPTLPARSASAPPPVGEDAPYLTHVVHHHGKLTLVAPDNHGHRRQPGTADTPPVTQVEGEVDDKKKKKKKKRLPAPEILRAVEEAGRPSPPPQPQHAQQPPQQLAVPSTQAGRSSGMSRQSSRESEGRRERVGGMSEISELTSQA